MTRANKNAMIMPPSPPSIAPARTRRTVSSVIKKTVFIVIISASSILSSTRTTTRTRTPCHPQEPGSQEPPYPCPDALRLPSAAFSPQIFEQSSTYSDEFRAEIRAGAALEEGSGSKGDRRLSADNRETGKEERACARGPGPPAETLAPPRRDRAGP